MVFKGEFMIFFLRLQRLMGLQSCAGVDGPIGAAEGLIGWFAARRRRMHLKIPGIPSDQRTRQEDAD
jgi:hypothetical protein